jgi:hypothetical protein
MLKEVSFTEQQRFNQWWVWMLLFGINAFFIFILVRHFTIYNTVNPGLVAGLAINLVMTFLFYSFKLNTQINGEGISIRFFPFHFTFKKYSWNELTKVYVREYSPISEFGGWGLRYGFSDRGRAYNVSGNMGLQLILSNGDKILIGTNKSEELSKFLREINQLKE